MSTQNGMEINHLKLKMSTLDEPIVDECVQDLHNALSQHL